MEIENPLHNRKPSAAYMESWRRAQANRERDGIDPPNRDPVPGWRTIATSVVCLITGFILFTIGAVYKWSSDGSEKHNQGMDLIIVGAILLVPGSFSCWVLIGAWMKWPGYFYHQVPRMENLT